MATGLNKKAREELLDKMIHAREMKQSTEHESCKDNSTLREKIESKRVKTRIYDRNEPIIIIKNFNIPKTREGGGKSQVEKVWTNSGFSDDRDYAPK